MVTDDDMKPRVRSLEMAGSLEMVGSFGMVRRLRMVRNVPETSVRRKRALSCHLEHEVFPVL